MNQIARAVTAGALVAVLAGCYHATIETGRPPSPQVVEKPWAPSFIYGIVPPAVLETASQCPNGVSKVETLHSFLNGLVAGLTFGIFTPMTLKVTCAAAGSRDAAAAESVEIERSASMLEQQHEMARAAQMSAETGHAVWVVFQ
ncbi:MAG TPA: Bor family protein [Gemmatimonadales bacterium]